ncbi:putative nucleotidyltransferase, ribonuclease H [Tanacetum coccineum]
MNSPPNHEWEEGLDIDDSDLLLTLVVRPTNNPHIVPEITTTTQTLISCQNHQVDTYVECEEGLDIDDSDLRLTPVVCPSNNPHIVPKITTTTQTLFLSQNNQVDIYVVKPIRIILGHAGIVQTAKLHKLVDTREGGEESVIAIDYVNVDGGIVTGCFGDVKKCLKNGKLDKIVVVIKSCTPNALGDLTVTLKDLSGTISDTIHYKVLTEERFTKAP